MTRKRLLVVIALLLFAVAWVVVSQRRDHSPWGEFGRGETVVGESSVRPRIAYVHDPEPDETHEVTAVIEADRVSGGAAWQLLVWSESAPDQSVPVVTIDGVGRRDAVVFRVEPGRARASFSSDDAIATPVSHEFEVGVDDTDIGVFRLVGAGEAIGTVRSASGTLIPNATVLAVPGLSSWAEPVETRTDENGRYRLEGLTTLTTYTVTAVARGFGPRREHGVRLIDSPTIELEFELPVAARLTGRVVTADRKPLSGRRLQLSHATVSESLMQWRLEGNAVTDGDGRFEIDCLEAGWKSIDTVVASERGAVSTAQWNFSLAAAQAHDLGELVVPDTEVWIQFRYPDSAEIVDADVSFATVYEAVGTPHGVWMSHAMARTDEHGRVVVRGLPLGRLQVDARPKLRAPQGRWRPRGEWEVDVATSEARFEWELPRVEPIPAPPADEIPVSVDAPSVLAGGVILVTDADGDLFGLRIAEGSLEGAMSLACNAGDELQFIAINDGLFEERSVTVGTQGLTISDFVPNARGVKHIIRVHDDGRPVSGHHVELSRPGAKYRGFSIGMTRGRGEVIVDGLPAHFEVEFAVATRVGVRRAQVSTEGDAIVHTISVSE